MRASATVFAAFVALLAALLAASGAQAAANATLSLAKTASVATVKPGEQLSYDLNIGCSGLTGGCLNATITDTLPAELEVTSLPSSSSERDVSYDPATRLLTITFKIPLAGGGNGLPAGTSRKIPVGMRLPVETTVKNGQLIPNSATATADNAAPKTSSATVQAEIPVVVRPVATKGWSPSSAIAQSGAHSTITLGSRNASSTSADVRQLRVTDTTPATFDAFDVTGLGPVSQYPPGTDRVIVGTCSKPINSPCAEGEWVESGQQSGGGALSPPPGVTLANVTGVRFTFVNAAGTTIPYSADAGAVALPVVLRDNFRASGQPIQPQTRLTIANKATPAAVVQGGGTTVGTDASANFAIEPDTITVQATKNMFADNAGNWTANGKIVAGEDSGVTMTLNVKNTSAGPVKTMVIDEPSTSAPQDFAKIDVVKGRFTWPNGTTSATLTVVCRSGANPPPVVYQRQGAPATVDITNFGCAAGVFPASVRLSYLGQDQTGDGTIVPTASGQLDLHGAAAGATTPGPLTNCFDGTATTPQSSSSAAVACKTVTVVSASSGVGNAVKSTSGVTTIIPGQAMKFDLSFKNTGNVPVTGAYIADPPTPGPPFDVVRLVNLSASSSPTHVLEVFDPTAGTYVTYNSGNAALLLRATGIRVRVTGALAPGTTFHVSYNVMLRDNPTPPVGTTFNNCAQIGIDGIPSGTPVCGPTITVKDAAASASISKLISPASVLRPEPGLPAQKVTVKHQIQNNGPAYLKRLILTDTDTDFFDAVDFGANMRVNFPPGANRVQIDVCTSAANCTADTFVNGTPTASTTPGLPAGVTADQVNGVRLTFSNSNNGYSILPGANYPAGGNCPGASFCFDATARQFLKSAPSTPIPASNQDTSTGAGESSLQTPGTTFPIPPSSAALDVVNGAAQIRFAKGPQSRIGPGDTAPFDLLLENTGTTAIVDPVISDPLPDALTLDENAPGGSPGRPFVITYPALPSGYPPLPPDQVTYTPTKVGNRITQVAWTFTGWNLPPGGKVNIRIYVGLTPGTPAGSIITNTGGAHGSNSTISCATGNPPVNDGPYGPGLYCTASAAVTSLAGNAVDSRKWSAGDPALGFLNTTNGTVVPTTDPGCPQYIDAGVTYTRYPCAPIVNPGDPIKFLIRMVNAGTNDLIKAVAVDGLPVVGDTGVLLSGDPRGTQWNNRPTMLTPVVNTEGYTGLVTEYTNNTFPGATFCTNNLQPAPGDTCPATAFDAPFSSGATGFRTTMTFPDQAPLAPGQGVTLTWTMQTPLTLSTPETMPLAWNSFAQKSTFTGNVEEPATEPLKAGAALRFGTVVISKSVIGIPPGVTLPTFPMAYRCSVNGTEISTGAVNVDDGATVTLPLQPTGALCAIWETNANGGSSPNEGEGNAQIVTVPDPNTTPDGVTVPIENSFQAGRLTISKTVSGAAANVPLEGGGTVGGNSFPFEVSCEFPDGGAILPGFPMAFNLANGETRVLDASTGTSLPAGSVCLVTEGNNHSASRTVLVADGSDPVTGDSIQVTVKPDFSGGSQVSVDNQYDAGTIRLTKTLSGDASQWAQGPYQFRTDCTFGGATLTPVTTTLTPTSLTADITPLPVGAACAVYETSAGDSPKPTPELIANVIVPAQAAPPVAVDADNPYPAGHVSLTKAVDGAAAGQVTNAKFDLRVQCQRDLVGGGTEIILDKTVTLVAGETVTGTEALPLGAKCWATETANGGATATVIDYPDVDHAVVITEQTPNVTVTATNTFDAGSIIVTKRATGRAPAGADYSFTLACTMPTTSGTPGSTYPVTLAPSDSTFSLKATQSRTVAVPRGATCRVVEANSHGAKTVTYTDAAGKPNGGIADITPTGTVNVTNIFPTGPTGCPLTVNGLPASTLIARNGTTLVVAWARTSSQCAIVIGGNISGVKVQCAPNLAGRGELVFCRGVVTAGARIKVQTFGYPGVVAKVTITATPKPGVTGYNATSWIRNWRVR